MHWNWCTEAMCSTVVCCNSDNSACADRNGMAAPRLLEWYSVESCDFDCVLQVPVVNHIVVAAWKLQMAPWQQIFSIWCR